MFVLYSSYTSPVVFSQLLFYFIYIIVLVVESLLFSIAYSDLTLFARPTQDGTCTLYKMQSLPYLGFYYVDPSLPFMIIRSPNQLYYFSFHICQMFTLHHKSNSLQAQELLSYFSGGFAKIGLPVGEHGAKGEQHGAIVVVVSMDNKAEKEVAGGNQSAIPLPRRNLLRPYFL